MKLLIKCESKTGKCSWSCEGKKYLNSDIAQLEKNGYKIINVINLKTGKIIE